MKIHFFKASVATTKIAVTATLIVSTLFLPLPCKAVVNVGTPPYTVTTSNEDYLRFVRYMTVPFASQNGTTWNAGDDITEKTPAQIQDIVTAIKALETDPMQKQIFSQMRAATEEFNFTDIAHAKGRVVQRLETIKKMQEFNIGDSSPYFYGNSRTNALHWQTGRPSVEIDGVKWNHSAYFRQKSGTAYEAIVSLCSAPSVTKGECLGAAIACVWWGGAQGMGETRFNALYPGTTALDMDGWSGGEAGNNLLAPTSDISHTVPGDWVYWQNHNYGEIIKNQAYFDAGYLSGTYLWQGENAFYLGRDAANDPRYEGLGLRDISNTEIRAEMQSQYNTQFKPLIDAGIIAKMTDAQRITKIVLVGQQRLVF